MIILIDNEEVSIEEMERLPIYSNVTIENLISAILLSPSFLRTT